MSSYVLFFSRHDHALTLILRRPQDRGACSATPRASVSVAKASPATNATGARKTITTSARPGANGAAATWPAVGATSRSATIRPEIVIARRTSRAFSVLGIFYFYARAQLSVAFFILSSFVSFVTRRFFVFLFLRCIQFFNENFDSRCLKIVVSPPFFIHNNRYDSIMTYNVDIVF